MGGAIPAQGLWAGVEFKGASAYRAKRRIDEADSVPAFCAKPAGLRHEFTAGWTLRRQDRIEEEAADSAECR